MSGHKDIVAGCRFTADGGRLLSWSYDGTLRLWDVASGREERLLRGHEDRVTAAAPSPDGREPFPAAATAPSTLGPVLRRLRAVDRRPAEVRACFFLLDGASVAVVDAAGGVALLSTPPTWRWRPSRKPAGRPQAADLSPSGLELALACDDGRVRLLALDGLEDRRWP